MITTDLEGRGGYTAAKVWQERLARRRSECAGIGLTVLRPGAVWGPGTPYPPGITAHVGRVHVVVGRASCLPLTYVENCATAFAIALEQPAASGETYNVVDGSVSARTFVGEYLR